MCKRRLCSCYLLKCFSWKQNLFACKLYLIIFVVVFIVFIIAIIIFLIYAICYIYLYSLLLSHFCKKYYVFILLCFVLFSRTQRIFLENLNGNYDRLWIEILFLLSTTSCCCCC